MVDGWPDRGLSFSGGVDACERAVVRREDHTNFLDPDSDAKSSTSQTDEQEKQPNAGAEPKRFPENGNAPQAQIIPNAHPGRGTNTPGKAEEIFSYAFPKPDRNSHDHSRRIAFTNSGPSFAVAQPGKQSRDRLA